MVGNAPQVSLSDAIKMYESGQITADTYKTIVAQNNYSSNSGDGQQATANATPFGPPKAPAALQQLDPSYLANEQAALKTGPADNTDDQSVGNRSDITNPDAFDKDARSGSKYVAPNPVKNTTQGATDSAGAASPKADPTAMLKAFAGGSSEARPTGPSATDKYLTALQGYQRDSDAITDREKQANLLQSSGQQEKTGFTSEQNTAADANAQTDLDKEVARHQSATTQADTIMKGRYKEIQDLAAKNIDPQRAWTNMDTGNKARLVVSSILGGFVHGWTGGKVSNMGLDAINRLVEQDAAAQVKNLQNKQQGLKDKMALDEAGFSRETASHATLAGEIFKRRALVREQISDEAAKYDNSTYQAAAEKANAELDKADLETHKGLTGVIYQADKSKEAARAAAGAAAAARVATVKKNAQELIKGGMPADEAMRSAAYTEYGLNTDPDKPFTSVESYKPGAANKQGIPFVMTGADGKQTTVVARNADELKQMQSLSTINTIAPHVLEASTNFEPQRHVQGTDAFANAGIQNRWNSTVMGIIHTKYGARSPEAMEKVGGAYMIQPDDSKATIARKVAAAQEDFGNTDMGSESSSSGDKDADEAGFDAIK